MRHSGYGYTGEQFDASFDKIYLRARWYDGQTGRFVSQDPWSGSIHQPRTLHKYTYALNNPLVFTDPSGQMCIAGFDVGWPGCTPEQREQAAKDIAFLSGLVSSPEFAEGFLLELIDTVGAGAISIGSGLFEYKMEQLGISSLGGCGNLPAELLTPYSNFVHNPDPYFQTGRAAGRLTALILGLTEISGGAIGSTVAVAAAPFTYGVSLGAGAVTLSISAHGAVVVGTVAVKEATDPLLLRLGKLASAFPGRGGTGSDQPEPSNLRRLTKREVREYGLHKEKQDLRLPGTANLYVDKTTGIIYVQIERGAPYEDIAIVPELKTR